MSCERFRCTGVGRERLWHVKEVCGVMMFCTCVMPYERFHSTGVGRERVCCIFIRYGISMLDNIFVFQASVFAARVSAESDRGI